MEKQVFLCDDCGGKVFCSLASLKTHLYRFHPKPKESKEVQSPLVKEAPEEKEKQQNQQAREVPQRLQSLLNEDVKENQDVTQKKIQSLVAEEVERQEIEVFHCEECDKFFSSKASLSNHMISHTDKYKCNNCRQGFSCRRFLEQHSKNKSNCEKLLLKKQKESLLNASYIFNPRDFVETIIQGDAIKNNNP